MQLNWGCTIINNKLIESNDLQVRKQSILRTHAWSAKKCGRRHTCRLCHAHYKDCIILLLLSIKSGKYCARVAWVRTTSSGKTDENITQINKFCITKVFLPVASDRHQYFLPVTSWNYLKSTGRQATFWPLPMEGIFSKTPSTLWEFQWSFIQYISLNF